jgi:hypothetical protein
MISRLLFVLAIVFFAHGVEGTSLIVENGGGDGEHKTGTTVTVSAGPAPAGHQFDRWTGDTAILADPSQATTSATIPSIAVSITATYKAISAEPATVAAVSAGTAGAPFAYVANSNGNNVSGYTINPTTGVLTPIAGSPFAAGFDPESVAVDPSGKFAYVANNDDNNVSGYTINPTTGVLTAIAGSPFAAGENPISVAVDPSGKFAYVANSGDNNVSGYTIDPTTGVLTAIAGSPFAAGTAPMSVAVTPSPSPRPSPSPSPSPTASPTPGGNCHITVTVLGITRTRLFPPADVGDQWSFRFHTFVDEIERVERIPALGTMGIPFFPGAAGPGPFVLFSNLLPKAPTYNIRVFLVAHEDDTTDAAGRLTGLPSQRGDDREQQNFEFGDVPCPSDTRLPRTIDVTRTAGGDANEANEPGATDRVRIRFRITLVDP